MTGGATDVRAGLIEACASEIAGRLASGTLELPSLPATAFEVLQLAQSADVDAKRLVELLERDQAMATGLLKLANSALYGAREPTVALQQAVARIGLSAVCDHAFAFAARSTAFRSDGFRSLAMSEWRHATLTAGFSREIARTLRRGVSSAYLAGLMHDVGRVVAYRALAEIAPPGVATESLAVAIADMKHVEIGRALVAAWRLPRVFDEAVAFHHDLESRPAGSDVAPIVALADVMADAFVAATPIEVKEFAAHPSAVALGLYPDDVAAVWEKREQIANGAEGGK